MTKINYYLREEDHVLRKENSETNFTVKLHFAKEDRDETIIDEIQEILLETYTKNYIPKGDD